MEYINHPCLGNCDSCTGSYELHNYLALKPIEYKNSLNSDYSEKVDYSMQ
ncbi:MAG: hypothetical protein PHF67_01705 [Candidatus Nanoarchaeia archaeon]|nr:hypothetical protein [Candidatus Nanoarchaeia archaeon]